MATSRLFGLAFVILGALAILWPAIATVAVEQLIAWLLVLAGLAGIGQWWSLRASPHARFTLMTSIAGLVLGLIFLFAPFAGARTLTILLGLLFILEAGAGIAAGITLRGQLRGWLWLILSGLVSLAMAVLIFLGWPASSAFVVGLIFGINLLSTGLALLMLDGTGRA